MEGQVTVTEAGTETLKAAKQYLLDHGWRKGSLEEEDERRCAAQAIRKVAYTNGTNLREVYNRLRFAIHGNTQSLIIYWNDLPSTTEQDVLDAFDRAIGE